MATATTGASPARSGLASHPVLRFFSTAIGLKLIMAVTGVMLSGFVFVHMLGNLKAYEGAEALNAYGKLLRVEPAILWAARLGLIGAVTLHIVAYLALTKRNLSARPIGYREKKVRESTYASRTMRFTGPLLALFIVYHILHLTTGTLHGSYEEGNVYHNLVTGLEFPLVAGFYVLSVSALGFHLWHGIWSMLQTLGLYQSRKGSLGKKLSIGFAVIVALGFMSVPISVLTGLVK